MTKSSRSFFLYGLAVAASLMFCMTPGNASMPLDPGYHISTSSKFEMPALALVLPAEQAVIVENRTEDFGVVTYLLGPPMKPTYLASYATHGLSILDVGRSR